MIPYLKIPFVPAEVRSSPSEVRKVRTLRYVLSYPAQPRTKINQTKSRAAAYPFLARGDQ